MCIRDSVKNHQKVIEVEEEGEDIIDVMEGEAEWAAVANQAAEGEVETAGLHEDTGEDATEEAAADADADAEGDEDLEIPAGEFDAGDLGGDDDNN